MSVASIKRRLSCRQRNVPCDADETSIALLRRRPSRRRGDGRLIVEETPVVSSMRRLLRWRGDVRLAGEETGVAAASDLRVLIESSDVFRFLGQQDSQGQFYVCADFSHVVMGNKNCGCFG